MRRVARWLLQVAALALLAVAGAPGVAMAATGPQIALPAAGATAANPTPLFSGTAEELAGEVTVEMYAGSEPKGTLVQSLPAFLTMGSWSVQAKPLLEGTYTAQAVQGTLASAPMTFTVLPPAVQLEPVASPAADATPTLTGTAGTVAAGDSAVSVTIYAGETPGGEVAASGSIEPGAEGGWQFTAPHLEDGTYAAVATQEDLAGNLGTSMVIFTVNVPPAISLTYPSSGSSTGGDSQRVEGGAGTATGDLPKVTVKLFKGDTVGADPLEFHTVWASNGSWFTEFVGLTPGASYTVVAEQSDKAKNTGVTDPVTFTVGAVPVPVPVPVAPAGPSASFKWFPAVPQTGEQVSLVSSSTDAASPIVALAWAPLAAGPFQAGGPVLTTSFATPGGHVVRLLVTDASGASAMASETINVVSSRMPLMQPFPVVRIAGTLSGSGVRLRLLTVQAPAGARIAVTCRGRGCPLKSASRVSASGKVGQAPVEFRPFERGLHAGVTLEVRVSKPGEIGKYTRLFVRHHKLPERVDMCLDAAGVYPMACPSS